MLEGGLECMENCFGDICDIVYGRVSDGGEAWCVFVSWVKVGRSVEIVVVPF